MNECNTSIVLLLYCVVVTIQLDEVNLKIFFTEKQELSDISGSCASFLKEL